MTEYNYSIKKVDTGVKTFFAASLSSTNSLVKSTKQAIEIYWIFYEIFYYIQVTINYKI